MFETFFNKLVRDKIPDIIREDGRNPITRQLSDAEFIEALDKKLLEEVMEYLECPGVEELADIMEVLEAIVAMRKIPQTDLRRTKNAKTIKKGSFKQKIMLEKVISP